MDGTESGEASYAARVDAAVILQQLKLSLYVRYVNVVFVWFFLSSVPMPVDKAFLAWCSGGVVFVNAAVHLFASATKRYRFAAYLMLAVDLPRLGLRST